MIEPVWGTPRHVCTLFRAKMRGSYLRKFHMMRQKPILHWSYVISTKRRKLHSFTHKTPKNYLVRVFFESDRDFFRTCYICPSQGLIRVFFFSPTMFKDRSYRTTFFQIFQVFFPRKTGRSGKTGNISIFFVGSGGMPFFPKACFLPLEYIY